MFILRYMAELCEIVFIYCFQALSLSIGDLVQLFFGRSRTVNQLRAPLQRFVREQALQGNQPTEENLNHAIDNILQDLHPHLVLTAVSHVSCSIFRHQEARAFLKFCFIFYVCVFLSLILYLFLIN